MTLDARRFEKNLKVRKGLKEGKYTQITYLGVAVELKLVDARTFGGVIRFSIDGKGAEHISGSSSQPMRIRNPFRFADLSSYRVTTQYEVVNLPDNVEVEILPIPRVAKEGFLILPSKQSNGLVEFTALTMRKMEISPDFPIAELRFLEVETGAKVKGLAELNNENTNMNHIPNETKKSDKDYEFSIDDETEDEDLLNDEFLDDEDDLDFDLDDEIDYTLEAEMPVEIVEEPYVSETTSDVKKESKPVTKSKSKPKTTVSKKSVTVSKSKAKK